MTFLSPYQVLFTGASLLIEVILLETLLIYQTFETDSKQRAAFEKELKESQSELDRLGLVASIPDNLAIKTTVQAKAFDVLTSLLNLIGRQLSYSQTAKSTKSVGAKSGTSNADRCELN